MKKVFLKCTIFLLSLFLANLTFAQDIIIFKTGDEIKTKVLEITPDLVKYKKWDNLEGPSYSTNKSEIFMIKYANGTKDIFKSAAVESSNSAQTNNLSDAEKFVGNWRSVDAQGVYSNFYYILSIEKVGNNFTVQRSEESNPAKGDKLPASYNKEKDVLTISAGMAFDIIYNPQTKTILFAGIEYSKRSKPRETNATNQGNINNNSPASTINSQDNLDSSSIIRLTTPHKGFYFDKIPGKSYSSRYIVNRDQSSQPSISKNFFVKEFGMVCWKEKFGVKDKYKDDKLVVNRGDSLILTLNIGGDVIKTKSPIHSGVWVGSGEYSVMIQVQDSIGKECYKDSWERVAQTRDADIFKAGSYNEVIKISRDKLQFFPKAQDLYLSFFIQGKNKKQMLEGFLKFKVEL